MMSTVKRMWMWIGIAASVVIGWLASLYGSMCWGKRIATEDIENEADKKDRAIKAYMDKHHDRIDAHADSINSDSPGTRQKRIREYIKKQIKRARGSE